MMQVMKDRFIGCLLGHAVGDALGAPIEGLPADVIYRDFGGAHRIVAKPPVEVLCYTDDTQMTIAVAETLLAHGRISEAALCQAFVENYDPRRGYGPGARKILDAMAAGEDWQALTQSIFPGGSLGNGAAMRVAPIGLLFHRDLDRVAHEAALSAMPTHVHPIGIEAAQLMALAVALIVREAQFDHQQFYRELRSRATQEEFQWQLSVAQRLGPDDSVAVLGSSLEAHRSVITAIACFTQEPQSYEGVITRAMCLGNDTDTVAAMAGSLSGAHLGISAIPQHAMDMLENQIKGRDYIIDLASRLWDLAQETHHTT